MRRKNFLVGSNGVCFNFSFDQLTLCLASPISQPCLKKNIEEIRRVLAFVPKSSLYRQVQPLPEKCIGFIKPISPKKKLLCHNACDSLKICIFGYMNLGLSIFCHVQVWNLGRPEMSRGGKCHLHESRG